MLKLCFFRFLMTKKSSNTIWNCAFPWDYCYRRLQNQIVLPITIWILKIKLLFILISDIESAETCLVLYSYDFGRIYGKHHMVFNTHGLPQMAKDCKRFGNLNNISCFRPESFLGTIKRSIRGKRNPQCYRNLYSVTSWPAGNTVNWYDRKTRTI